MTKENHKRGRPSLGAKARKLFPLRFSRDEKKELVRKSRARKMSGAAEYVRFLVHRDQPNMGTAAA